MCKRTTTINTEALVAGCLQIDNCVVYYNGESASGEIELGDSAFLSVKNSSIVCKGNNKKALIKADGKGARIAVEKCNFFDCNYLFKLDCFSKFEISYCHIIDPGSDFLIARHRENTELSIDSCHFEMKGLTEFNKIDSYTTVIGLKGFGDLEAYTIRDCLFTQYSSIFDSNGKEFSYTFVDATYTQINNCTIRGMRGSETSFKSTQFFDNIFVDSERPIKLVSTSGVTSKIAHCLFDNCSDVLDLAENSKVENCQFISCRDHIIDGDYKGGCKIEYCEFVNVRHEAAAKKKQYLFYHTACLTFRRVKGKDASENHMVHCIFNGADVGDWLLIDITGYEKPAGNVLRLEKVII